MTASGSLAGSETPDDSDPWFGCFTGDCQHETQNGCNAAIRAEFARMERELHRIEAVAPSVESDPAPAHIAKFDKALGQMVFEPLPETAAPVAGIDVEATALAALLRDCADDREQEAHDSLAHTPEAFESFMADARRLRAHADALPLLVSGQADTGRPSYVASIERRLADLTMLIDAMEKEIHQERPDRFGILEPHLTALAKWQSGNDLLSIGAAPASRHG